ncbi:MAG: type II toxin-antitoxin system PrlF family antitoxin [Candidatus Marinimicrobia bacterium]|nr:type II toxin-antitoxin system PrlF family antitoxin [Candidatus Neomarinimicrobiota bacterium]
MSISTITTKGQVTIPKKIRDYLHLQKGDSIDFKVSNDGKVYLDRPEKSILKSGGMLSQYKKDKPVSIEEMNEAVMNEAAEKVLSNDCS